MNTCYKKDEWLIIEEGFHPELNRESESIFSIGNGYMGQRANFEEHYSGDSLRGNYVAGVYYPDKTRVGWWKNGYPEFFAKVLNAPRWTGIDVSVNGNQVDLATAEITSFARILNMKDGLLDRKFSIRIEGGRTLDFASGRFLSMMEPDAGIIRYSIRSSDFDGTLGFSLSIDADVRNEDANYGKKFWKEVTRISDQEKGIIVARTLKTDFHVATGMRFQVFVNGKEKQVNAEAVSRTKFVACTFLIPVSPGDEVTVIKYAVVLSSLNNPRDTLVGDTTKRLGEIMAEGYDQLIRGHREVWQEIWNASDVIIEGDVAAQQAIRFNIFHLNQTYTGKDERLNIGPKGFTGEKYGGSTYWDTEAFALPFFLKTAGQNVARNLLLYRYKHLPPSIKNAAKLGFSGGAALYPMVTMNGEECHNEWEITFEEIHRNGAIAYAIYNYIRHTGDTGYMADYGLEVLIGISRFWSQRITWSENRKKYVMLGVTGPNEYENNVSNNWYTSTIASWTLSYTIDNMLSVRENEPEKFDALIRKTDFDFSAETGRWKELIADLYLPYYHEKDVFLQQDGFLDKELVPAGSIPQNERPINQHWSWDRILRSCFIKQADVLQGLYFFEDKYDTETLKRNFDFYEPMTVHESSLSACIHSILASRIGYSKKAYDLYLRTARLDLDDYNNEVAEGLHITSMAGTWLAVVEGFGGMRITGDYVRIIPDIPPKWKSYSFHVRFRGLLFEVTVTRKSVTVSNLSDSELVITVYDSTLHIDGHSRKKVKFDGNFINKSK